MSEMIDVAVTLLRPSPTNPVELSRRFTPCGSACWPPKYFAIPCAWQPLADSR